MPIFAGRRARRRPRWFASTVPLVVVAVVALTAASAGLSHAGTAYASQPDNGALRSTAAAVNRDHGGERLSATGGGPGGCAVVAGSGGVSNYSACVSGGNVVFQAAFTAAATFHHVFINSDGVSTTGYRLPSQSAGILGADYMIEEGKLYKSTCACWQWSVVAGVSPDMAVKGDVYSWTVPISALGGSTQNEQAEFNVGASYSAPISFSPVQSGVLSPYALLYDPGPTSNCYGWVINDQNPQGGDRSGCSAERMDPTFSEDGSHSAWDMGTYNWTTSSLGDSPGYGFTVTPANGGGSETVTMRNSATDAVTNNCGVFHETNVSFTYPGMEIRPGPDYRAGDVSTSVTMGDGDINVSYDARIAQNGTFMCPQKRALLTTDFVLQNNSGWGLGAGQLAVISVAHFDPGPTNPLAGAPGDVIWETRDDSTPCDGGCRVMIRGDTQIPGGSSTMTPIADDFSELFQEYQAYIDPSGAPASDFSLRGIQIVSSNEGSDTTASVNNIQATLTPSAIRHSAVTYGIVGNGGTSLCLDDFGGSQQAGAAADIWPCTTGDSAQDWTYGWDGTLRVNGLCLDAWNRGTTVGTPVRLYTCNGGSNQQFIVGRWNELWNPVSQLCLAVKGSAASSGYSSMDLESCTGQPNEHWYTAG